MPRLNKLFLLASLAFVVAGCQPAKRPNTDELLRKAFAIDSTGQYALSLPYYDTILSVEPDNVAALNNRGRSRFFAHDTVGALNDINKALLLKPNWHSFFGRAEIRTAQRKKDAIGDLWNALKLSDSNATVLGVLSMYYAVTEPRPDSALFYADRVMLTPGKDYTPFAAAMTVYLYQNKYMKLIQACDSVIKYVPSDTSAITAKAFAYNNKGFALLYLNHAEQAMASIRTSLAIYPQNSYAWKNMGLAFLNIHNNDSACVYLEKARTLGYKNKYGNEVDSLIQLHCH